MQNVEPWQVRQVVFICYLFVTCPVLTAGAVELRSYSSHVELRAAVAHCVAASRCNLGIWERAPPTLVGSTRRLPVGMSPMPQFRGAPLSGLGYPLHRRANVRSLPVTGDPAERLGLSTSQIAPTFPPTIATDDATDYTASSRSGAGGRWG